MEAIQVKLRTDGVNKLLKKKQFSRAKKRTIHWWRGESVSLAIWFKP